MSKIKSGGRKTFSNKKMPPLDPELIGLMNLVEAKQHAEVENCARRILGRRPGQPLAMKALSYALIEMRRYEEALPILRHLVEKNGHDAEIQNNLGIALNELMFWEESLQAFSLAMQGMPEDPELVMHMGMALSRMRRWNDAVPYLLKAIELYDGDYVKAVEILAICLANARRIDEAWTCYRELHQAFPENTDYLSSLVDASLKRCDWSELEGLIQDLRCLSAGLTSLTVNPFSVAATPSVTRDEMFTVARHFVKSQIPRSLLESAPMLPRHAGQGGRIRIGYISGDLLRHPVGFIIPEIIERHDRAHFEVYAYSLRTAEPDDPIRPRLERAFDHFREVGDLSVRKLSQRIREDLIDVLIDLTGWTAYGRPEALAFRCAPIQVNWLGYPGTMGHSSLADYIIGDPVVTPLEHAAAYSEKIAQLPYCYLPADTTRQIAKKPTRAEAGLPEGRFVFCSLNNSYKYNPDVWDLWCAILRETPNSVLWLSFHGDAVVQHLKQEAVKRGVAAERLFFAQHVPSNEEHLARLGLADLALDPFPYNSHSTGIDTLWAGVPMVSMLGEHFASRVGASALMAAELAELVVYDSDAYRQLAIALYADPARLGQLRKKLEQRSELPLFNMAAFTQALEGVFMQMLEEEEPRHLPVA